MADIGSYGDLLLSSAIDLDLGVVENRTTQQVGLSFWQSLGSSSHGDMVESELSVQERQRGVIRQMLSLSEDEDRDEVMNGGDTWKVLIYDSYCRDIISPLFKVGDLKRMNVTLHMMLHSDREPIPDVPAIYFMQPTQDNIARVCADGAAGLYGSMALNFSSEVPRSLMEKLAGTMVANDAVNVVSGIFDQYTSFVSLEPTLFSLAERDVFPILNDPTMKDTAIIDCVERIVDGLFSFCVTMGSLPVIRCGRGGSGEMVAQKLDAKLRDHLHNRNNLFADALAGRGAVGTRSRPVMVILERGIDDLAIMLQHSYTYQSQIHDLLSMRLNVVSHQTAGGDPQQRKVYDVDVNEPFYCDNARLEFPKVAENIEQGLERYKQKVEEVNRETGGNSDAASADVAAPSLTAKLSAAIAELPKLKETKRVLDMHTEIARLLLEQVQQRTLNEYWDLESEIMASKKEGLRGKVLTLLQKSTGSSEDKLRLLLIYFWHADEPATADIGDFVDALRQAGGEDHALHFLRAMKQQYKALSRRDSMAKADKTNSLIASLGTATSLAEKASSMVKDTIGLESDQTCRAAITVAAVMANRSGPETDHLLYLDPNQTMGARAGASVARQQKPFSDAFVFSIGGGNYVEYEQILRLAKGGRQLVYGSTDIVSPRELLAQLTELGKRAR